MIITCPACATQFRVDGTKISTAGTKVRCARCSHVWLQTPDKALPYPGAAAAPAKPSPPPPAPPQPQPRPAPEPVAAPVVAAPVAAPPPPPLPPVFQAAPQAEIPPAFRPAPQPEPVRAPAPSPFDRPRPAAPPPPRPQRPAAPFPTEAPAPSRAFSLGTIIAFFVAMLVVGGLVYGFLHFRGAVTDRVPIMGRFYETIGLGPQIGQLSLQNVTYGRIFEDGVPILEVRGEVVNTGKRSVELPRIQAVLRDKDGTVLSRWTFSASKNRSAAKETVGFVSRYPSPPPHAVSLALSFATKGAN